MSSLLYAVLTALIYPLLALSAAVIVYAFSGLVQLMVTQYFSHLGDLKSPPVPSLFWGHLQMLHDAENTNLLINWMEQLGTIFTYRGFIGGYRLVTMDPCAITHILARPHEYPKPGFVRDTLASMAGEQGLLVVEGETHKRQRRILNPSFNASQVRDLAPIFHDKAAKLRDIWLALADAAPSPTPPASAPHTPPAPREKKPSHKTLLSPATPTLPLTPPSTLRLRKSRALRSPSEGSAFALAQSLPPRLPEDEPECEPEPEPELELSPPFNPAVRVDVLNWLGRATLDVIGLAGFGYAFDALVDDRNVLAAAFAEVFSAARKFRFVTVLQAWFPILGYFRTRRKHTDKSMGTMRAIGLELIRRAHERLACMGESSVDLDVDFREREDGRIGQREEEAWGSEKPLRAEGNGNARPRAMKGRDLLSLLIKSNLAEADRERMSQDEILSQISTFMAAGHETTSSALTWTLYILAQHPACQDRLRAEACAVASPTPAPDALNALPYLDMVVRESLRLHSPVSQTMRVASRDDVIPVDVPYHDARGRLRGEITIKKGDIISIPIQAMNKSKMLFGKDAEKFVPERWEHPPDGHALPTLYSNILTFLYGGRACIGHRFALLEMKVFLFVLVRSVRFDTCADLVIEKRVNVVTRPLVKSEPERGNQMPLLLSRASRSASSSSLSLPSSSSPASPASASASASASAAPPHPPLITTRTSSTAHPASPPG